MPPFSKSPSLVSELPRPRNTQSVTHTRLLVARRGYICPLLWFSLSSFLFTSFHIVLKFTLVTHKFRSHSSFVFLMFFLATSRHLTVNDHATQRLAPAWFSRGRGGCCSPRCVLAEMIDPVVRGRVRGNYLFLEGLRGGGRKEPTDT